MRKATVNLNNLLVDEFIEIKPKPIDLADLKKVLGSFYSDQEGGYSNEILTLDVKDVKKNYEQVLKQVKKACDKMVEYGFKNAASIAGDNFKISALLKHDNTPNEREISNAKQIKTLFESIFYIVKTASPQRREMLVKQFRDRYFACGDGTLKNLQVIYLEMTLGKLGLSVYIGSQKRDTIDQIVREMYHNNIFADGFVPEAGMEIHHITGLTNVVAPEFGLAKTTPEEDRFMLENRAVKFKDVIKQALESRLSESEVMNSIIDGVVSKLMFNLPIPDNASEIQAAKANPLGAAVLAFFDNLGLKEYKANYYILVNTGSRGEAVGYKHNIEAILKDIVSVYFHEKGIYVNPEIDLAKRRLALEGCYDEINTTVGITKELLGDNPTSKDWLYIFENGLKVFEGSEEEDDLVAFEPFEYAIRNSVKIDGEDPFKYFIKNNLKIKGEDPKLYAIANFDIAKVKKLGLLKKEVLNNFLFETDNPQTIAKLISLGADVNHLNELGQSKLHVAKKTFKVDLVKLLEEKGAKDIDSEEEFKKAVAENDHKKIFSMIKRFPKLLTLSLNDNRENIVHYCAKTDTSIALFKDILELVSGGKTPYTPKTLFNYKDKFGNTVLHTAAEKNNLNVANVILKTKAGKELLSQENLTGYCPLHLAVYFPEMVEALLSNKEGEVAVCKLSKYKNTPLHLAVYGMSPRREKVVDILLATPERRKAINAHSNTPLHSNIVNVNILKKLLKTSEGRAALVSKDGLGNKPLYYAIYDGNLESVIEILKTTEGIESLKQTNRKGHEDTYLHQCFGKLTVDHHEGDQDNVEKIINKIVGTKEGRKQILLHKTIHNSYNIEYPGENTGTPLHIAISGMKAFGLTRCPSVERAAKFKNTIEIQKKAILNVIDLLDNNERKALFSKKNYGDETIVHNAIFNGRYISTIERIKEVEEVKFDFLKKLLAYPEAFSSLCEKDHRGRTPLYIAVSRNDARATAIILKSLNPKQKQTLFGIKTGFAGLTGETVLDIAISNKDLKMVKLLLTHGATPSYTTLRSGVKTTPEIKKLVSDVYKKSWAETAAPIVETVNKAKVLTPTKLFKHHEREMDMKGKDPKDKGKS